MLQMQQKRGFFMNLLENPLFTGILPEELDQMKTCFEMENRTFREKEEIPMEGKSGHPPFGQRFPEPPWG